MRLQGSRSRLSGLRPHLLLVLAGVAAAAAGAYLLASPAAVTVRVSTAGYQVGE